MKQELKNCPFCDGKATLIQQTNSYVQCEECLASTSTSFYEDVAINAWNTRPDHSGESGEMVKGETLTTEIDWEQRRYELIKVILAKFDAEDFKSTTDSVRDKSTGSWRTLSIPPIAETQAIRIADELINQLKQHKDER